jgi:hypothetical protein
MQFLVSLEHHKISNKSETKGEILTKLKTKLQGSTVRDVETNQSMDFMEESP